MGDKLMDCRAAAASCLATVHNGNSLNQQIPLYEIRVKERDRPLFRQLCYGVLRLYPQLLTISQVLLKKPLKNKDSDILMLILLGGYQLTDTRIPEHAAVSATVAATKHLNKTWSKALVNGVLRQWQRQQKELVNNLTPAQLSAHPDWLYQIISRVWPDQAEDILDQNNQHPPMCLRVNQLKETQTSYLEKLNIAMIKADACEYSHEGIRLDSPIMVNKLPGFQEGLVSVQDEAAQLAAQLLSLEPNLRVLDACCAPGGKTCHILETEPDLAEVIALDVSEERLVKVQQNLSRLNLSATVLAGNAKQPEDWWNGQPFDRILLDAPCSATGVIRRNPDIKLHRQYKDIKQLAELQLQLLMALWKTLKPGGFLLYATCSIIPDENEEVIRKFCHTQEQAEHKQIQTKWGIQRPYGRQLFPQHKGHDGFYYAMLRKKEL